MIFLRKKLFLLAFAVSLLFAAQAVFADDWREVTPAELAMKTSKVEPNADAEAIFWEVRVDDSSDSQLVMKNYVRIKIFTERGREKYSKIDIQYVKGISIKDISARVIKPDGTIVELSKNDIFEREVVKADKFKIKAKSFAVPNIEVGSIIEYRYQEVRPGGSASRMEMIFQRDIPVESISYYFKPYNSIGYSAFNMEDVKFVKDKNGFSRATMENVPAVRSEPQMPPESEVRSWIVFKSYDESAIKGGATAFWAYAGYFLAKNFEIKDTLKPGKEIKAAAAEITAGATAPDEQVGKIFDFVKTKIKNISFDTQLTDDQKDDIKPNKSTLDTYKKLQGNAGDVDELFASMTSALGLETRLVFGGNRSVKFFNIQQANMSFIHFIGIAVKVNGVWQYYDPGSPFVPYKMLAWNEEGTDVLLLNSKDFVTDETPLSNYDKSVAKRTGKFKLLEDGTLEGTVKTEYTGQLGYTYKLDDYKDSVSKQEDDLKEDIKSRLSSAEITDIKISNVADPVNPLTYEYKIRVPNYAQKTGKRLFFQPGFFEAGKNPMFSASERKYQIFFHFPWSEEDDIQIELPKGYALDNADSPSELGDSSKISNLKIKMTVTDNSLLNYKRSFYFGNKLTLFPVESYPLLKNLFDSFQKANSHSLTVKQS